MSLFVTNTKLPVINGLVCFIGTGKAFVKSTLPYTAFPTVAQDHFPFHFLLLSDY